MILPRMARRMDMLGRSVELRAQREPALAEAIRLLGEVDTQAELFAAVELENQASQGVRADARAIR